MKEGGGAIQATARTHHVGKDKEGADGELLCSSRPEDATVSIDNGSGDLEEESAPAHERLKEGALANVDPSAPLGECPGLECDRLLQAAVNSQECLPKLSLPQPEEANARTEEASSEITAVSVCENAHIPESSDRTPLDQSQVDERTSQDASSSDADEISVACDSLSQEAQGRGNLVDQKDAVSRHFGDVIERPLLSTEGDKCTSAEERLVSIPEKCASDVEPFLLLDEALSKSAEDQVSGTPNLGNCKESLGNESQGVQGPKLTEEEEDSRLEDCASASDADSKPKERDDDGSSPVREDRLQRNDEDSSVLTRTEESATRTEESVNLNCEDDTLGSILSADILKDDEDYPMKSDACETADGESVSQTKDELLSDVTEEADPKVIADIAKDEESLLHEDDSEEKDEEALEHKKSNEERVSLQHDLLADEGLSLESVSETSFTLNDNTEENDIGKEALSFKDSLDVNTQDSIVEKYKKDFLAELEDISSEDNEDFFADIEPVSVESDKAKDALSLEVNENSLFKKEGSLIDKQSEDSLAIPEDSGAGRRVDSENENEDSAVAKAAFLLEGNEDTLVGVEAISSDDNEDTVSVKDAEPSQTKDSLAVRKTVTDELSLEASDVQVPINVVGTTVAEKENVSNKDGVAQIGKTGAVVKPELLRRGDLLDQGAVFTESSADFVCRAEEDRPAVAPVELDNNAVDENSSESVAEPGTEDEAVPGQALPIVTEPLLERESSFLNDDAVDNIEKRLSPVVRSPSEESAFLTAGENIEAVVNAAEDHSLLGTFDDVSVGTDEQPSQSACSTASNDDAKVFGSKEADEVLFSDITSSPTVTQDDGKDVTSPALPLQEEESSTLPSEIEESSALPCEVEDSSSAPCDAGDNSALTHYLEDSSVQPSDAEDSSATPCDAEDSSALPSGAEDSSALPSGAEDSSALPSDVEDMSARPFDATDLADALESAVLPAKVSENSAPSPELPESTAHLSETEVSLDKKLALPPEAQLSGVPSEEEKSPTMSSESESLPADFKQTLALVTEVEKFSAVPSEMKEQLEMASSTASEDSSTSPSVAGEILAVPADVEKSLAVSYDVEERLAVPTEVKENLAVPSEVENNLAVPSEVERLAVPSEVEGSLAVPSEVDENLAVPSEVEENLAVPCEIKENSAVPSEEEENLAVPSEEEESLAVPSEVEKCLAVPSDDDLEVQPAVPAAESAVLPPTISWVPPTEVPDSSTSSASISVPERSVVLSVIKESSPMEFVEEESELPSELPAADRLEFSPTMGECSAPASGGEESLASLTGAEGCDLTPEPPEQEDLSSHMEESVSSPAVEERSGLTAAEQEGSALLAAVVDSSTRPTAEDENWTSLTVVKEGLMSLDTVEDNAASPSIVEASVESPAAAEESASLAAVVDGNPASPAPLEESAASPAAVEESAVSPAAVEESAASPAVVEESAVSPAAVESAASPAAIEESAASPAAVEETAAAPAAVKENAASPAAVEETAAALAAVEESAASSAAVEESAASPAAVPISALPQATVEDAASPVSVEGGVMLPAAVEENAASPSFLEESAASPAAVEENAASPAAAEENAASSAAAEENAASSAAAEENAASPAAAEKNVASPAAVEENAASPAALEENAASPAALEENAASPAALEESAASPAAQEKSAASPAAQEESAASPAAQEESATSPAALEESATSPAALEESVLLPAAVEASAVVPAPVEENEASPAAVEESLASSITLELPAEEERPVSLPVVEGVAISLPATSQEESTALPSDAHENNGLPSQVDKGAVLPPANKRVSPVNEVARTEKNSFSKEMFSHKEAAGGTDEVVSESATFATATKSWQEFTERTVGDNAVEMRRKSVKKERCLVEDELPLESLKQEELDIPSEPLDEDDLDVPEDLIERDDSSYLKMEGSPDRGPDSCDESDLVIDEGEDPTLPDDPTLIKSEAIKVSLGSEVSIKLVPTKGTSELKTKTKEIQSVSIIPKENLLKMSESLKRSLKAQSLVRTIAPTPAKSTTKAPKPSQKAPVPDLTPLQTDVVKATKAAGRGKAGSLLKSSEQNVTVKSLLKAPSPAGPSGNWPKGKTAPRGSDDFRPFPSLPKDTVVIPTYYVPEQDKSQANASQPMNLSTTNDLPIISQSIPATQPLPANVVPSQRQRTSKASRTTTAKNVPVPPPMPPPLPIGAMMPNMDPNMFPSMWSLFGPQLLSSQFLAAAAGASGTLPPFPMDPQKQNLLGAMLAASSSMPRLPMPPPPELNMYNTALMQMQAQMDAFLPPHLQEQMQNATIPPDMNRYNAALMQMQAQMDAFMPPQMGMPPGGAPIPPGASPPVPPFAKSKSTPSMKPQTKPQATILPQPKVPQQAVVQQANVGRSAIDIKQPAVARKPGGRNTKFTPGSSPRLVKRPTSAAATAAAAALKIPVPAVSSAPRPVAAAAASPPASALSALTPPAPPAPTPPNPIPPATSKKFKVGSKLNSVVDKLLAGAGKQGSAVDLSATAPKSISPVPPRRDTPPLKEAPPVKKVIQVTNALTIELDSRERRIRPPMPALLPCKPTDPPPNPCDVLVVDDAKKARGAALNGCVSDVVTDLPQVLTPEQARRRHELSATADDDAMSVTCSLPLDKVTVMFDSAKKSPAPSCSGLPTLPPTLAAGGLEILPMEVASSATSTPKQGVPAPPIGANSISLGSNVSLTLTPTAASLEETLLEELSAVEPSSPVAKRDPTPSPPQLEPVSSPLKRPSGVQDGETPSPDKEVPSLDLEVPDGLDSPQTVQEETAPESTPVVPAKEVASRKKFSFAAHSSFMMTLSDGQKLFTCDICSGVYQRAFSLKRHYLRSHINYIHLHERDISNCGIIVGNKMAVQTEPNTAVCLKDSKITVVNTDEESEEAKKSTSQDETNELGLPGLYRCFTCGVCFDLKDQLRNHLQEHKPTADPDEESPKENLFTCEICAYPFRHKKNYLRHLDVCQKRQLTSDQSEWLCLFCNKTFQSAAVRSRHLSCIHKRIRPGLKKSRRSKVQKHTCMYCATLEPKFNDLNSLLKHMITSHEDVYFGCLLCEERYPSKTALEEHTNVTHSEDAPSSEVVPEASPFEDACPEDAAPVEAAPTVEASSADAPSEESTPTDSPPAEPVPEIATPAVEPEPVVPVEAPPVEPKATSKKGDAFQFVCSVCKKMFVSDMNMKRHKQLAHGGPRGKKKRRAGNATQPPAVAAVPEINSRRKEPEKLDPEALFYSRLSVQIRENLMHHLDGKLDSQELYEREEQEPLAIKDEEARVPTPNPTVAPEEVPEVVDIHKVKNIPRRRSSESYLRLTWDKFNINKDKDSRSSVSSFIRDMSHIDIPTQLIMRRNMKRLSEKDSSKCVQSIDDTLRLQYPSCIALVQSTEGARSLETATPESLMSSMLSVTPRVDNEEPSSSTAPPPLPKISLHPAEDFLNAPWKNRDLSNEVVELSGEWVRPKYYLCAACDSAFLDNLYEMEDHLYQMHPNVWGTYWEFQESTLIPFNAAGIKSPSSLYQRSLKPTGSLISAPEHPASQTKDLACTKCSRVNHSLPELHRHMLDCGGDTTWHLTMILSSPINGRRNRKWRPFGSRRRRQQGRRGLKRNIPNTPQRPKTNQPKTRGGDAETIQRMIANLPAKRSTRRVIQFKEDEVKTRSQATMASTRLLRKRFKVQFPVSQSPLHKASRAILGRSMATSSSKPGHMPRARPLRASSTSAASTPAAATSAATSAASAPAASAPAASAPAASTSANSTPKKVEPPPKAQPEPEVAHTMVQVQTLIPAKVKKAVLKLAKAAEAASKSPKEKSPSTSIEALPSTSQKGMSVENIPGSLLAGKVSPGKGEKTTDVILEAMRKAMLSTNGHMCNVCGRMFNNSGNRDRHFRVCSAQAEEGMPRLRKEALAPRSRQTSKNTDIPVLSPSAAVSSASAEAEVPKSGETQEEPAAGANQPASGKKKKKKRTIVGIRKSLVKSEEGGGGMVVTESFLVRVDSSSNELSESETKDKAEEDLLDDVFTSKHAETTTPKKKESKKKGAKRSKVEAEAVVEVPVEDMKKKKKKKKADRAEEVPVKKLTRSKQASPQKVPVMRVDRSANPDIMVSGSEVAVPGTGDKPEDLPVVVEPDNLDFEELLNIMDAEEVKQLDMIVAETPSSDADDDIPLGEKIPMWKKEAEVVSPLRSRKGLKRRSVDVVLPPAKKTRRSSILAEELVEAIEVDVEELSPKKSRAVASKSRKKSLPDAPTLMLPPILIPEESPKGAARNRRRSSVISASPVLPSDVTGVVEDLKTESVPVKGKKTKSKPTNNVADVMDPFAIVGQDFAGKKKTEASKQDDSHTESESEASDVTPVSKRKSKGAKIAEADLLELVEEVEADEIEPTEVLSQVSAGKKKTKASKQVDSWTESESEASDVTPVSKKKSRKSTVVETVEPGMSEEVKPELKKKSKGAAAVAEEVESVSTEVPTVSKKKSKAAKQADMITAGVSLADEPKLPPKKKSKASKMAENIELAVDEIIKVKPVSKRKSKGATKSSEKVAVPESQPESEAALAEAPVEFSATLALLTAPIPKKKSKAATAKALQSVVAPEVAIEAEAAPALVSFEVSATPAVSTPGSKKKSKAAAAKAAVGIVAPEHLMEAAPLAESVLAEAAVDVPGAPAVVTPSSVTVPKKNKKSKAAAAKAAVGIVAHAEAAVDVPGAPAVVTPSSTTKKKKSKAAAAKAALSIVAPDQQMEALPQAEAVHAEVLTDVPSTPAVITPSSTTKKKKSKSAAAKAAEAEQQVEVVTQAETLLKEAPVDLPGASAVVTPSFTEASKKKSKAAAAKAAENVAVEPVMETECSPSLASVEVPVASSAVSTSASTTVSKKKSKATAARAADNVAPEPVAEKEVATPTAPLEVSASAISTAPTPVSKKKTKAAAVKEIEKAPEFVPQVEVIPAEASVEVSAASVVNPSSSPATKKKSKAAAAKASENVVAPELTEKEAARTVGMPVGSTVTSPPVSKKKSKARAVESVVAPEPELEAVPQAEAVPDEVPVEVPATSDVATPSSTPATKKKSKAAAAKSAENVSELEQENSEALTPTLKKKLKAVPKTGDTVEVTNPEVADSKKKSKATLKVANKVIEPDPNLVGELTPRNRKRIQPLEGEIRKPKAKPVDKVENPASPAVATADTPTPSPVITKKGKASEETAMTAKETTVVKEPADQPVKRKGKKRAEPIDDPSKQVDVPVEGVTPKVNRKRPRSSGEDGAKLAAKGRGKKKAKLELEESLVPATTETPVPDETPEKAEMVKKTEVVNTEDLPAGAEPGTPTQVAVKPKKKSKAKVSVEPMQVSDDALRKESGTPVDQVKSSEFAVAPTPPKPMDPPAANSPTPGEQPDVTPKKRKSSIGSQFFCDLCQRHYSTAYNLTKHLSSLSHRALLRGTQTSDMVAVTDDGKGGKSDASPATEKTETAVESVQPFLEIAKDPVKNLTLPTSDNVGTSSSMDDKADSAVSGHDVAMEIETPLVQTDTLVQEKQVEEQVPEVTLQEQRPPEVSQEVAQEVLQQELPVPETFAAPKEPEQAEERMPAPEFTPLAPVQDDEGPPPVPNPVQASLVQPHDQNQFQQAYPSPLQEIHHQGYSQEQPYSEQQYNCYENRNWQGGDSGWGPWRIPDAADELSNNVGFGLGSILDSVNQVLAGDGGVSSDLPDSLYAGYALNEIQNAVGATDEEMAVLRQLGEGSFEELVGAPGSVMWPPAEETQLLDLDNQRPNQPPESEKAVAETSLPPSTSRKSAKSPAPSTSGTLTPSKTTEAVPSTSSRDDTRSPVSMLPRPKTMPAGGNSLNELYEDRQMWCPSCHRRFLGLQAMKAHMAQHHSQNQRVERKATLSAEGSSEHRIICEVCREMVVDQVALELHMEELHSGHNDPSKAVLASPSPGAKSRVLRMQMSHALGGLLDRALKNYLSKATTGAASSVDTDRSRFTLGLLNKLALRHQANSASQRESPRATPNPSETDGDAGSSHSGSTTPTNLAPKRRNSRTEPLFVQYQGHPCPYCPEKFMSDAFVKRHINNVHANLLASETTEDNLSDSESRATSPMEFCADPVVGDDGAFLCSSCGINFKSPSEVLEHQRAQHQPTPEEIAQNAAEHDERVKANTPVMIRLSDIPDPKADDDVDSAEIAEKVSEFQQRVANPLKGRSLLTKDLKNKKIALAVESAMLEHTAEVQLVAEAALRELGPCRKSSKSSTKESPKWGIDAVKFTVAKEPALIGAYGPVSEQESRLRNIPIVRKTPSSAPRFSFAERKKFSRPATEVKPGKEKMEIYEFDESPRVEPLTLELKREVEDVSEKSHKAETLSKEVQVVEKPSEVREVVAEAKPVEESPGKSEPEVTPKVVAKKRQTPAKKKDSPAKEEGNVTKPAKVEKKKIFKKRKSDQESGNTGEGAKTRVPKSDESAGRARKQRRASTHDATDYSVFDFSSDESSMGAAVDVSGETSGTPTSPRARRENASPPKKATPSRVQELLEEDWTWLDDSESEKEKRKKMARRKRTKRKEKCGDSPKKPTAPRESKDTSDKDTSEDMSKKAEEGSGVASAKKRRKRSETSFVAGSSGETAR